MRIPKRKLKILLIVVALFLVGVSSLIGGIAGISPIPGLVAIVSGCLLISWSLAIFCVSYLQCLECCEFTE